MINSACALTHAYSYKYARVEETKLAMEKDS